ncbi:hypothetical protein [Blautia sp. OF03-13]|uniref:hypothetical protein n=1 Tax=Blautia sp. OF03-13 TaxID=2292980 RepID=UPI0011C1358D|nr:hypothetical protein [Blautia sp. OF03-13]
MEDRRVRGAGSRSDHHLGTGGTPGTGPEAGDREQRGTAARLLRRENRQKSYVAAGRQNPGWAAAVPGWQRDSFLRFSQIPRMRDGVCWRMIA